MFSSLSLKYRIAIIIFFLEAIMMAVVLQQTLGQSFEESSAQINNNERAILDLVSGISKTALITEEYAELQPYIAHLLTHTEVTRLLLADSNEVIVASNKASEIGAQFPELTKHPDFVWHTLEISNSSGLMGKLSIEFSKRNLAVAYSNIRDLGITIAIVGMLIIAAVGVLVGIYLTRRLEIITATARRLEQGDFSARTNIHGNDELGELATSFDSMVNILLENRKTMQLIMDNSVAVIYAKDIDGRYIFINKQWETLFDKDKAGVVGKTDYELFPKEFADGFVKNDKAVIQARHALESEETAPQEDGVHTYVTVKFPLIDDDGIAYAVCGISTDITSRKRMEDEIHSSEQRLKLYREQAPMATIEWNTDFQVVDWNKAAEEMFGYTLEEVKGREFVDIMLPKNAIVDVKQIWINLMAQNGGELSINENLTKDGSVILCEWHNTALIDDHGNVVGAASIVQNITERTQQDEMIRRSQKMDALGKLTGGIAHDYNNMLGVILGYSQLMEKVIDPADNPKIIEYIDQISHAAERGTKLTEKLLSFTRKKSTNEENININSLLQYEKDMLEKTMTASIKLKYELAENIWSVWLDNSELEDVIINLSINAMHAMNGKGIFRIKTENTTLASYEANLLQVQKGDYVLLSFTDTGCGMDEVTKEKMFDPFYSTKGESGTGLGLSQVYGFVQRSHGAIKVNSELNVGTSINLYFPRIDKISDGIQSEVQAKDVDLNGAESILVVDDESSLRSLAENILSEKGYSVISAESAQKALDILESTSVDLLLSDVIMPEMDGYQLAHVVKENYPDIKIQLVSGYTYDRNVELVDNDLHKNLIHKPYDMKTLLIKIRRLLDKP